MFLGTSGKPMSVPLPIAIRTDWDPPSIPRNAPEVVREVGVDDVRMTTEPPLLHLYDCLLGVPPRPVGVDFWWKIGFKDRFQNQRCRRHADPIPHVRDAQRPQFAVGLGIYTRLIGSGR